MNTYGLLPTGFVPKPLQQIKLELEQAFQSAFGATLDVSDDSNAGILIGNLTKKFADQWDLLAAVYASFDPDDAEGVQLDRTSALTAIVRLAAAASTAWVMLYGTLGTTIPQGHLVNQVNTLQQFSLIAATTIALANAGDWTFHVGTVTPLTAYSVTINGIVCTYTSGSSDTAAQIVAGLLAVIDALITPVTVAANGNSGRVYATDGATAFNISSVDAKLTTDLVGIPGQYQAAASGPITVPTNTITGITNPISGLSAVNNIIQGVTGSNTETDAAFRIRRRSNLQKGLGTDSSIQTALESVAGVSSVTIIDNRTDSTVSGMPPHSIQAVVSGGTNLAIAKAIWACIGAGCNTYGTTSQVITDANGSPQTVYFSRPVNMYVFLNVVIHMYTEETLPSNAVQLVQNAIAAWALANYEVGNDVILQRLIPAIYGACTGLGDITITAAAQTNLTPAPSGGSYAATDIAIDSTHIAVILANNVQVGIS